MKNKFRKEKTNYEIKSKSNKKQNIKYKNHVFKGSKEISHEHFQKKKHMQWKTKNVKTGPGLRANPAFGLGPKAAPRPSHGQARKDSSSMAWSLMTKRFAVFISHDTQALNLRRSAFYCFFAHLKKKVHKKIAIFA